MGRIPEEKIQEVKDRVDIVEVVSGYLPLKRSGANHQGLCPFHQEKTPSFNVNAPRQIFHCFGCGEGGNVFTFLMKMEGLSFPEAVRRLGEKVGVEIEEEETSPAELRQREERDRLARIYAAACTFYHQILLEDEAGAVARRYLRQRGYEGETVRAFQVGFAPDQWEALANHLEKKGFAPAEIRKTGLVREGKQGRGDYDLFRNRLLFPIQDLQGRVVAFGGRVLDDSLPKYINSPESPIYHKGRTLYGLYPAREAMRQTGEALVVEGYFDVLALHRAGFGGAVAACGTALTGDHARLLKRYADKILLVFDEDAAGRQATFRAMDALLPEGLSVMVVAMPPGEDPDSLLREKGAAGFQECLKAARPVLEVFLEDQLTSRGDTPEDRARAAEEALKRIRRLPSDLERDLYVKRLAELSGIDAALLAGKASRSVPKARSARPTVRGQTKPATSQPQQRPTALLKAQEFLLRMMLDDDTLRAQVRAEGVSELFLDETHRHLAQHILDSESGEGGLSEDLMTDSLPEAAQALLAKLLLEGADAWQDNSERMVEDCLQTIAREGRRQRYRELPQLISAAEQAEDWERFSELSREYQSLKKSLER